MFKGKLQFPDEIYLNQNFTLIFTVYFSVIPVDS